MTTETENQQRMEGGDGTWIDSTSARTRVRGGGYGGDAWIAKIMGSDPKYHFKREFCPKDRSGLSGSGASGHIDFTLDGPGLYEFRKFCVGSTARNWEWSGFMLITEGGGVQQISQSEATKLAEMMV